MNLRTVSFLIVCTISFSLSANPLPKTNGQQDGLLILAYGMSMVSKRTGETIHIRSEEVAEMAKELNQTIPTEVAFGLADPEPIQDAVNHLQMRGVKRAVVVPVFVTSHSAIIGNSKYILGLQKQLAATSKRTALGQIKSTIKFQFASAMDTDPMISKILFDKALESSKNTKGTTLILIAHGPENKTDNDRWMQDMQIHAEYLRNTGRFKNVLYTTLRSNSPKVDEKKIQELRAMVEKADAEGDAVLVPIALSIHGIERPIKNYLQGLNYAFGSPMMPHPNIQKWVVDNYRKANVRFSEN